MEYLGYAASVFIGITIGLLGTGSGTLTLPVLVYLFYKDSVAAGAYALFIGGFNSLFASLSYFKDKLVDFKIAAFFGIPAAVSAFLTRAYIIPLIPKEIVRFDNFTLTKGIMFMAIFAVLLILAALSMLNKLKISFNSFPNNKNAANQFLIIQGVIVGFLTSLVGAGGGFLVVPALVVISKLPMKKAIGTGLVIVAAKSLFGFLGESSETLIDWLFISKVCFFVLIGVVIGVALSKRIDGQKLKPVFGWFILFLGVLIFIKEIFMKM
ncbi:MAG: sulfite exporter TauE/SafE family protein [Chitinophagales bacterium]|nr:sulfite exporter TauE/SafE family protein [Chitinophagales bacterium]